eukprot:Nitzschia sp. Nitz4//scaffold38_size140716//30069//34406//NITZ4_003131-RA/size140716-processed-gene-0.55-mRNA-1//-1//CDS//3329550030//8420//frame0
MSTADSEDQASPAVEKVPSEETTTEVDANDDATVTETTSVFSALEKDFIYHQTNQPDNAFFKALSHGFRSLKEVQEVETPLFTVDTSLPPEGPTTETPSDPKESGKKHLSSTHVVVSVIDPTSKPVNYTEPPAPKATNMLSRNKATTPAAPVVENVFSKLNHIFRTDYGSTLRSVQYKNMRSGESDVISSIPVELALTRTGTASGTGEAANVAWGGMAASSSVSDPSDWHNGPFCHIYIAACESMEHYRTKVRPSLQAFVSQLDLPSATATPPNSLLGTPAGNGQSAANNPQFLIVYIPTGSGKESAGTDESGAPTGPVRRAFASQFAKARERIISYNQENSKEMDNSQHSKDSAASGDQVFFDDDPESVGALSLNVLSQSERALYHKLKTDFSAGLVCVFSKASLSLSEEIAGGEATGIGARTQEWNSFNRMLGAVIVGGFKDRCRKYKDELRRLDSQRAAEVQAAKSPISTSKSKNPPTAFNLGYFFLVKESLAFTYEQMQLPADALMQYDEFRAFLADDLDDKEYKRALKMRRKSKALKEDPPLIELADAGDSIGFRRRIRSEFDLNPILDILRRYLFAREISLLFKMEQPVEVVSRCETFCKMMYFVMMRDINVIPDTEQQKRRNDAARWVIQFAWDVKSACEPFLLTLAATSRDSFDSASIDTPRNDHLNQMGQSDQQLASRLGELLETARLLLKELGDTELPEGNPLRTYDKTLPTDMFTPWSEWVPVEETLTWQDDPLKVFTSSGQSDGTNRAFLVTDGTFTGSEPYESVYLSLVGAIVNLSRFGHRKRIAARLQAEMAEYLVRHGHLKAAAAIFKSTAKIYRMDQWDRLHFWRLFRLAHCQRLTAAPTDYLKTLVTCFGPGTSSVAPRKALEALQNDLERVIAHPEIGQAKYGTIAFLETAITIQNTSSEKSSMGSGVDMKQLLKRFCAIGETVRAHITVTSYLPRPITLESLKLFIVDFASFTTILENRESVEEEDAFKIIGNGSGVTLNPGLNNFAFDWQPASAGQYILSTLEVVWKQGFFYYDSMELDGPLLGVDVMPSDPTQSICLEPTYIVPGRDQDVKLIFDSGSDIVVGGKIRFSCPEGTTLLKPATEDAEECWAQDYEISLAPCQPGEQREFVVHLKSALVEASTPGKTHSTPSGLSVKALCAYLHPLTKDTHQAEISTMKTVLECDAPLLQKSAMSVESVNVQWLIPMKRAIVSVDLVSNTPHQFFVEEWKLNLPPPLAIVDTNYNDDLFKNAVADGDRMALIFECNLEAKKSESSASEASILMKIRDLDKLFEIELPLDLNEFYLNLLTTAVPPASGEVKATLQMEATEGEVGQPVKLTFTVDTQAEGDIVYSISAGGSDWLLGGKVSGSMQRSGFMSLGFSGRCEVIAIPAVPGILTQFPTIEVGCSSFKGYTPLSVSYSHPDSFRSKAKTSEVGIGFPSISKVAV